MKILDYKKIISWLAAFIWMAVIFYLSAQPGGESSELSSGVMGIILSLFENLDFDTGIFHYIIRKSAHFTAYFILSILLINAIRMNGIYSYRAFFLALAIAVLYAISDEIHQAFVPGRGPAFKDVLIDSAGALFGLFMYILVFKVKDRLYSA